MNNFLNFDDIESIIQSLESEIDIFKNKKIVISGAFGFIGKYFLKCLLMINEKKQFNIDIYAIDNFITSNKDFKNYYIDKGIQCIDHDINNEIKIDVEFDFIICLAGIASPYYYKKFPNETLNVSINGLKNMFNLKHNEKSKFIFFSSSEIYGDPPSNQIPTKESFRGNVTSIGPRSCYDESKRIGETICFINSTYFKKKTAIIRPFNVYGPGMSLEDYRIIPNITKSLIYDDELKIYDTGNQTRTYCYVSDAINGFLKVIAKDEIFGVYNIGNDKGEISVIDLVKTAEEVMKKKINYKITPYPSEYPPDEPKRRCPNLDNANKNLNYYPKISLNEGLEKHLNWSIKNIKN